MFRDAPADLQLGSRLPDPQIPETGVQVQGKGFRKDGVRYLPGDFLFLGPEVFDAVEGARSIVQLPEYLSNSRFHKVTYSCWGGRMGGKEVILGHGGGFVRGEFKEPAVVEGHQGMDEDWLGGRACTRGLQTGMPWCRSGGAAAGNLGSCMSPCQRTPSICCSPLSTDAGFPRGPACLGHRPADRRGEQRQGQGRRLHPHRPPLLPPRGHPRGQGLRGALLPRGELGWGPCMARWQGLVCGNGLGSGQFRLQPLHTALKQPSLTRSHRCMPPPRRWRWRWSTSKGRAPWAPRAASCPCRPLSASAPTTAPPGSLGRCRRT